MRTVWSGPSCRGLLSLSLSLPCQRKVSLDVEGKRAYVRWRERKVHYGITRRRRRRKKIVRWRKRKRKLMMRLEVMDSQWKRRRKGGSRCDVVA